MISLSGLGARSFGAKPVRQVVMSLLLVACMAVATADIRAEADDLPPVIPVGEEFMRDGVAQRFWGVNVNLQPWHDAESIDAMARRIRESGFNAVRLWPNWKTLYGSDVRNSRFPPRTGFKLHPYERGDGSQLDLFDRMVFRCRENGLSIYMTALMYYPPVYPQAAFVDLVETDPADRAAWIAAIGGKRWDKGVYDPWWGLHYFDERFQAIWLRHAELFLNHVNPYTGLRYADDNNIVMWQLHNESRFFSSFMLNNEYRKPSAKGRAFPHYFQSKLQKKYNEYLRARYGTSIQLSKAWNGLRQGESLDAGNVDAGAKDPDNKPYGAVRIEDFTQFIMGLVKQWNERFTSHVRAQGKNSGISVTAIATNATSWPDLAYYPALYQGSMVALGNYPDPRASSGAAGRDISHWKPKLATPNAWAPFDFARPHGKPAVIYEINYNSYALYDADLPWLVALFSSWQNINGVFFYFWNAPLPSDGPDPYGNVTFAYRGKEIWGDEVFSAALQAAGDAYLGRQLPTAQDPVTFSIPEPLTRQPEWRDWVIDKNEFGNIQNSVRQAWTSNLRMRIVDAAFTRGSRISIAQDNGDSAGIAVFDNGVRPIRGDPAIRRFPGVIWSGVERSLWVDRPGVKAFVGFTNDSTIHWSDGFSVRIDNLDEITREKKMGGFVAVSITSLDNKPLVDSGAIRLVAVSHSYHADKRQLPDGAYGPGEGEVIMPRVAARYVLPPLIGKKAIIRDFRYRSVKMIDVEELVQLPKHEPIYDVIVYSEDYKRTD